MVGIRKPGVPPDRIRADESQRLGWCDLPVCLSFCGTVKESKMPVLSLLMWMGLNVSGNVMQVQDWIVVNDTVMGGVSTSKVSAHKGGGVFFEGELSLENNGGFTSARQVLKKGDWSEFDGLRFEVQGDGRQYLLTIRPKNRRLRRIYYRSTFQTSAGKRTTHAIAFKDFEAYAFGTRVPQAPPLQSQLDTLGTVGVMLADKKPGAFSLHIASLSATRSADFEKVETPRLSGSVTDVFSAAIERGVPLFNAGEADRCADIYQTAIVSTLLLAGEDLTDAQYTLLVDALRAGRSASSQSERAWSYRIAMDAILKDAQ